MTDPAPRFRTEVYPYVSNAPTVSARIRSCAEDFVVDEVLGFEPDAEGQHLLLRVRKRERNTHDVVKWLSERLNVPRRDIGFCGLKDRVAVTTQWFSLPVMDNQRIPDGMIDGIEVIEHSLHGRKLRRGQHRANRFEITLREVSTSADGVDATDVTSNDATGNIEQRFKTACENGVPNYFGPQRFGRGGENIDLAMAMLAGQHRPRGSHIKGILLSSLRSFLFNEILAQRVLDASWNCPLDGDYFESDDRDGFPGSDFQTGLSDRCAAFEVHPTGSLPGPGDTLVSGKTLQIENDVLECHADISSALLADGPAQDRRILRLKPRSGTFRKIDNSNDVVVGFELGRGSFATSLLREVVNDAVAGPPWQP